METPVLEKKKFPKFTTLVIIATLLMAGYLRFQQEMALRKIVWADLTMREKTFSVEVADNDAKREKGLGDRDSLASDHGMYFPFPASQYWVFWMKGMRFPIDIVWIQDGKVVDVSPDVPVEPGLPLKTYSPVEPADAVLELNAGTARQIGLQKGDAVVIGQPGSPPQAAGKQEPIGAPATVPSSATATPAIQAPAVSPGHAEYVNESRVSGNFSNRSLGIAFSYPSAWGSVVAQERYLPGFDTGKAVVVAFSDHPGVRLSFFTQDYAEGVGEGLPARFTPTGEGPVRTLAEARSRISKDILIFNTTSYGYWFALNVSYGGSDLVTAVVAPRVLKGEYTEAQVLIDPVTDAMQTKVGGEPFTPEQAATLLADPKASAEREAVRKLIESLKQAAI